MGGWSRRYHWGGCQFLKPAELIPDVPAADQREIGKNLQLSIRRARWVGAHLSKPY